MPFTGYRKTSLYGWRINPITGKKMEFHAGIDLVKSHKAAIAAFTPGTVVYAGFGNSGTGLGGYGNVVLIKDKNGRGQLYAHLDSVAVKTGQTVSKGQTIGRQGATGQVTGSHLHFEVRKKTSPSYGWTSDKATSTIDPTKYLKDFNKSTSTTKDKQVLYLPSTASSWRVYTLNKAPTKGNEKGFLNPKKFGGLQYDVLGNPQKDVYTIKTKDFGTVNIYAGKDTSAKITGKASTNIKVGAKVKIKSSASKYATGQTIPSQYKNKTYTIQQIKGDRVLLKEIMSWVYKKDVQ